MALSPFALRLPGSQHHTGFWSLKPVEFCQAGSHPQARRGPSRLPPPGPVLFMRLLSGVAGVTLDSCPTPSPPTLGPLHAQDAAAAPVSCLGGPVGWKTIDVGVCKHPEPTRSWFFSFSSSQGIFSPPVWGGVKTQVLQPGCLGSNPAPLAAALILLVEMFSSRVSGTSLHPE